MLCDVVCIYTWKERDGQKIPARGPRDRVAPGRETTEDKNAGAEDKNVGLCSRMRTCQDILAPPTHASAGITHLPVSIVDEMKKLKKKNQGRHANKEHILRALRSFGVLRVWLDLVPPAWP
jgi:hypothetical protein